MTDQVLQPGSRLKWAVSRVTAKPGPVLTVLVICGACVGLGLLLQPRLPKESLTLIFLVGVLLAATSHGVWAGIWAALLASAAINYFFIPPVFTLIVADPEEVFALGVFIMAAILTGSVAGRMRHQSDAARRRAEMIDSLDDYAAHLMAATSRAEILRACGSQLARTLDHPVGLLVPQQDDLVLAGSWPDGLEISGSDWHSALRARRTERVVQRPADPDRDQRFAFYPLLGAHGVAAVLGIHFPPHVDKEGPVSVSAILRHASIALARLDNADDAAEARAAAREEQLRNAVLTSLSHDLRTPLSTILGAVTTLRQLGSAMPEESRADLLSAIEDEAGRLSRYVANLLDMTRVEAGALTVHTDCVDIPDLIGSVARRAQSAHPGTKFSIAAPTDLPPVRTDATILGQALFNLLDNAAKYAGRAGPVTVTADHRDRTVRLAVTDQGPGIPAAEQPRIFEKFRRIRSPDATTSGSGLGLAIAKGMVTALGGTILLESPVAANRGSRFILSLPVSAGQDGSA